MDVLATSSREGVAVVLKGSHHGRDEDLGELESARVGASGLICSDVVPDHVQLLSSCVVLVLLDRRVSTVIVVSIIHSQHACES